MLAITHKIVSENLQIERTTGLLPSDSLDRFDASLRLNRIAMINGQSLLSSFEPVEYCLDLGRWTDYVLLSPDTDEIKRRFWSPGYIRHIPFQPGSTFSPFTTLNP